VFVYQSVESPGNPAFSREAGQVLDFNGPDGPAQHVSAGSFSLQGYPAMSFQTAITIEWSDPKGNSLLRQRVPLGSGRAVCLTADCRASGGTLIMANPVVDAQQGPGHAYVEIPRTMLTGRTVAAVPGEPKILEAAGVKVGPGPGNWGPQRARVSWVLKSGTNPGVEWSKDFEFNHGMGDAPISIPSRAYLADPPEFGGPWTITYSIQYFDHLGSPLTEAKKFASSSAANYLCAVRTLPCKETNAGLVF
jgi:hypothetical protein